MSRIPTHTTDNAPMASQDALAGVVQFSPTGRPLNLHAQMAHSPAVLIAYTAMRKALAEHGTLGQPIAAALMLAAAGASGSVYAVSITSRLASAAGWDHEQVEAMRTSGLTGDPKTDALVSVVRQAAADSGLVSDTTWGAALVAGWSDEELTEAYAYLGLTLFTAYFLNYAKTELDLPAGVPAA